jgi:hypothetical protein
MDISILGFKINLEILILIGVVYLILVGHTVCSCCNISAKKEGMGPMDTKKDEPAKSTLPEQNEITVTETTTVTGNSSEGSTDAANPVPASSSVNNTSTSGKKTKESFVGSNTNYGESAKYSTNSLTYTNPSQWGSPNITIMPGKGVPKAAQAIIDRPNQSLPLPEGQLSLFNNMPFSPDCCPNTYSNSMGCACMNPNTYNYLISRGGNNVPYSEY